MKILITGVGGQIGLHLLESGIFENHIVYGLTSKSSFKSNIEVIPHIWGKKFNSSVPEVDVVIHLSAQTSAYEASENLSRNIKSNELFLVELVEKIKRLKSPVTFISFGSITEHGLKKRINEKSEMNPMTFYDVAKCNENQYLRQMFREKWIYGNIRCRLANIYGSGNTPSSQDRSFVDSSIKKAINGEALNYYGSGKYLRDYLHIQDLTMAVQSMINLVPIHQQCNLTLATGKSYTVKNMLETVSKYVSTYTGKKVNLERREFPPKSYEIERRSVCVNNDRTKRFLSWEPKISMSKGIEATVRNQLSHVE